MCQRLAGWALGLRPALNVAEKALKSLKLASLQDSTHRARVRASLSSLVFGARLFWEFPYWGECTLF